MQKKLKIRLYPNGEIKVETEGVKGKKCLEYAKIVADSVNAKILEQELTKEYYETDVEVQNSQNLYE